MPSTWLVIDSDFPSFKKDTPMNEQVSELQNYMVTLIEQLRYQLTNLNANNWNDTAMKQFQEDTTKDVVEELKKQAQTLKELVDTLEKLTERVKGVETTQDQLQVEVAELEKRAGSLEERTQRTETDIAWLQAEQEKQNDLLDELEKDRDELQIEQQVQREQIERMETAVKSEEKFVTIGDGKRPVHIVGEVYINGVKAEIGGKQ